MMKRRGSGGRVRDSRRNIEHRVLSTEPLRNEELEAVGGDRPTGSETPHGTDLQLE
jgi:hypothetical protein